MSNIKEYFKISDEIFIAYRKEALRYNSVSIKVLALFIFAIEIFNIYRVVFLSDSGLTTLNNRIYFYMYVSLFCSAAIFLLIEKFYAHENRIREMLYILAAYIWMLWHILLNCYEIYFRGEDSILLFIIAVYVFSACAQVRARLSVMMLFSHYLIFLFCAGDKLGTGNLINASTCIFLSMVIVVRNYLACVSNVKQRLENQYTNQKLDVSRRELEFNLGKYRTVMNYTNDFIFELDLCSNEIYLSDNIQIKGTDNHIILDASDWINTQKYVHNEDRSALLEAFENIIVNKKVKDLTLRIDLEEKGVYVWYRLRMFLHLNQEQEPIMILGIFTNIDVEQRNLEVLEKQVEIDPMTGLLNSVTFRKNYYKAIRSIKENECLGMLLIDLDNFKYINDEYGHYSGDVVLKAVARVMTSTFRSTDYIARVGGDEFAIIMANVTDKGIVELKAKQLIEGVAKLSLGEQMIKTTCSVGIMTTSDELMPYKHIFNKADSALYEAKRTGKSCFCNATLM